MAPIGRVTLALAGALLAAPLAGQTAVSIYSDGRAVVRQTIPDPLVKGRNTLALDLDGVDPAMMFSPDTTVSIVSAVLHAASDRATALAMSVGQTLAFVRGKDDTVRATVLRVNPPQYRLADGRLLMSEPGEPLFPADLVRSKPALALVLEASRPRPATELAYLTEGARWDAAYQVLLGSDDGATAWVSGAATILTQTLRADAAAVQLVAGSVARAGSGGSPMVSARFAALAAAPISEDVSEAAVGELHVYTLPSRLTLEPGVALTTALFPRAAVPVTEALIVPGALPFRGYVSSLGAPADPSRVPVEVWYTLRRPRGTPFGDQPLPAGVVQIYQADSAGRVQLLGAARSEHTAPGRDLRVESGEAFDVTAERVQTDYVQETVPPAGRGLPATRRVTASYRVTITNAKPRAVTVDVREARAGTWAIVASSSPPEKLSSSEMRFLVTVPAGGDATLTYTVRVES